MVVLTNFFEQVENLEPHCPGCGCKTSFGITTAYQEQFKTHVCNSCGHKF